MSRPSQPERMVSYAATFAFRTPQGQFLVATQPVSYFGEESVPEEQVRRDALERVREGWAAEGSGPPAGSVAVCSDVIRVCQAWVVGENRVDRTTLRVKPQLDIDPSWN